jgi:hypothetical protein
MEAYMKHTGKDDFNIRLAKKANDNIKMFEERRRAGATDTETLIAIIQNPDVDFVAGIFPDKSQPSGFEVHVIKGANVLREIVASGKAQPVRWDAIKASCIEEAIAMSQVFGDGNKSLN